MEQINSTLHQRLAHVFSSKIDMPLEFFVTISKVKCASDLKTAKVYLSILPFPNSKEGIVWIIRNRKEIQRVLGREIKMKYTPILKYFLDDSEEKVGKIYSIMDNL